MDSRYNIGVGVKSIKVRLASTYMAIEATGKDEICRCK